MRHFTFDLLVRHPAAEEGHRSKLRGVVVKYAKRIFIVLNVAGFCYGYWKGIQMIHAAYGGGP